MECRPQAPEHSNIFTSIHSTNAVAMELCMQHTAAAACMWASGSLLQM
jgi:hypothetical protein